MPNIMKIYLTDHFRIAQILLNDGEYLRTEDDPEEGTDPCPEQISFRLLQ